jgi:hypothetical protein
VVSVVLFLGMKQYWLASFSRTLPPTFIRLIGLNFDASCTFPSPGLTTRIILTFFHLFGKHPARRYSPYKVYVNVGDSL